MTITIRQFFTAQASSIWSEVKPKHFRDCLGRLEAFCNYQRYGERSIDSFKPSCIHTYFNHLADKGLTGSSINRHAAAITSVFKYAVDEELITHVPRIKWRKENKSRPLSYDEDQVAKLIRFFQGSNAPWIADMAILAVNTGMRLGEILMLDEGKAKVLTDEDGDRFIWLPETKNGDERWVPLNDQSGDAVERLQAIKGYYSHRKFYDTMAEARHKVCGGNKAAVFHTFRHTAATKMANDLGINTELIGKMLGHRSSETTKKYIKLNKSTMKSVAKQMAI